MSMGLQASGANLGMANKLAEIEKAKRKTQMPDPLRNSFNTAHFSHELVAEGEDHESSHTEQSYVTEKEYG